MPSQAEKGLLFRALHHRDRAFLIPNPWDIGTAKILAHLGFEALATTSAGYAFSQGLPDGRVGRDAMLSHAASIASANDLPVSADLENGYGHSPEEVAETIRLAAVAGLAGCSIEDATGDPSNPIYTPSHARDRIQAAVSAVRSLPFPFTLTARAENYLHGRCDLHDTILRLQAYQEAGADVLYAPGLVTSGDISAVVSSVARPVNVLAGLKGMQLTLAELSDLGVKRVSVGSGLSNAAMGAFLRASGDMLQNGAFNFGEDTAILAEIKAVFAADSRPSA